MVTIPRATTPVPWSLRGEVLEGFLRFARALLEFHEDRQAYLVARYIPDVLTDDDIKVFFVSGHPVDAKWLDAHWPVMAATDLYERARMANDAPGPAEGELLTLRYLAASRARDEVALADIAALIGEPTLIGNLIKLVAAIAELADLIVLHVDKDFELITEVTGQPLDRLDVT